MPNVGLILDGLSWLTLMDVWWIFEGFFGEGAILVDFLIGFDELFWWMLIDFDELFWWMLIDFDGLFWWMLIDFDGLFLCLMDFDWFWWILWWILMNIMMDFDWLWWIFWWMLMSHFDWHLKCNIFFWGGGRGGGILVNFWKTLMNSLMDSDDFIWVDI